LKARAWPEGGADAEEEGFVKAVKVVQKSADFCGAASPLFSPGFVARRGPPVGQTLSPNAT
jgi:hypothetical protein